MKEQDAAKEKEEKLEKIIKAKEAFKDRAFKEAELHKGTIPAGGANVSNKDININGDNTKAYRMRSRFSNNFEAHYFDEF